MEVYGIDLGSVFLTVFAAVTDFLKLFPEKLNGELSSCLAATIVSLSRDCFQIDVYP